MLSISCVMYGTNLLHDELFLRSLVFELYVKKKKAVPLHAMEAHGGRGGIAPTHT
jgi:hypothetical protein